MTDQSNGDTPRRTVFMRGVSSSALVFGALLLVAVTLTLPRVLHSSGMGPVTATSVTMIAAALLINRFAPSLGLYPRILDVSGSRWDPLLVTVAVFGGATLWFAGAILARILVTDDRNVSAPTSSDPYLLTLAFILVIAPVTEEILYRGLLQGSLNRLVPAAASVLLTTFVFAGVHPRPRDMVAAVAIGLLAGTLREVFGTMTAPILVHIAMNTASMLVPSAAVSALAHCPAAVPVLILLALVLLAFAFRRPRATVGESVDTN